PRPRPAPARQPASAPRAGRSAPARMPAPARAASGTAPRPPSGRAAPATTAGRAPPPPAPSARRRPGAAILLRRCRCPFQRPDVDLPHLQHRGHDALRLLPIRILEQLRQPRRADLPRQAEPVPAPAAGAFLPAVGELAPVGVDLVLALAHDLERDRLVERA